MSLRRLRKPSRPRRGPGTAYDDECVGPGTIILAAFFGGAAPVIATYLLSKLDPDAFEADAEEIE